MDVKWSEKFTDLLFLKAFFSLSNQNARKPITMRDPPTVPLYSVNTLRFKIKSWHSPPCQFLNCILPPIEQSNIPQRCMQSFVLHFLKFPHKSSVLQLHLPVYISPVFFITQNIYTDVHLTSRILVNQYFQSLMLRPFINFSGKSLKQNSHRR